MNRLKRLLLVLISAGWVLPFWLAVDFFLQFVQMEAYPRLCGQQPINSFPYLSFISTMSATACLWLAVAIAVWSWRLSRSADVLSGKAASDTALPE